jgi:hypothetical protein
VEAVEAVGHTEEWPVVVEAVGRMEEWPAVVVEVGRTGEWPAVVVAVGRTGEWPAAVEAVGRTEEWPVAVEVVGRTGEWRAALGRTAVAEATPWEADMDTTIGAAVTATGITGRTATVTVAPAGGGHPRAVSGCAAMAITARTAIDRRDKVYLPQWRASAAWRQAQLC